MNADDEAVPQGLAERSRAAGEMLERSLLRAVGLVEAELARVVRTGEAEIDRLARAIAETLAKVALDGVFAAAGDNSAEPPSKGGGEIGAALSRAARQGARFS